MTTSGQKKRLLGMDTKPEPQSDHEWAVRALLALLRKSRQAVRDELMRRAREL